MQDKMTNKINLFAISRLRTYTDGDGISTLVTSVGCPLRCGYCINPNSWDGSKDTFAMTVDELYEEVKRDHIYFLSTNGGIVFGGGEPLLYHQFIKEFIEKYKKTKWKFLLETSLSTPLENLKNIIDDIDYFIVDSKDMDKTRYELYTKGDYELFLNNLIYLKSHVSEDKIRIRVPRIKELHNSDEVESNYKKLKDMGFKNIEIFNYVDEIEKLKGISDKALKNKKEFLERINGMKNRKK